MSGKNAAELIEQIGKLFCRLTVPLEASGRHVHLSRPDVEALFGPGYCLTPIRELSQPGQFACKERVTLVGPGGELPGVVVLGPERPETQAEVSLTDAVVLGVRPPVRLSGRLEGTPGFRLRWKDREITLERGLLAARRHIHLPPEEAARFGVKNGQTVQLKCFTARPLIFGGVEVRVSADYAPAAHLDYDEANACGFVKGNRGMILP